MKYFTTIPILFFLVSQSIACDYEKIGIQDQVLMTTIIHPATIDRLSLIKDYREKIKKTCDDPLDYLPLTYEINGSRIVLNTELIDAEIELLALESELFPISSYYEQEYQKTLNQLLSLYIRAGRYSLAKYYARKIVAQQNVHDKDALIDAQAVLYYVANQFGYSPKQDLNRVLSYLDNPKDLSPNSILPPYRPAQRYLLYLQGLLEEGEFEAALINSKPIVELSHISKATTLISNSHLSILLTNEVVKALSQNSYIFPTALNQYITRKQKHVSLENQLIVLLLKANEGGQDQDGCLHKAVKVFDAMLLTNDLGQCVRLRPQLSLLLEKLLLTYPNNKQVQKAVFKLSQFQFVTNPLLPVAHLSTHNKPLYKRLVIKQQALITALDASNDTATLTSNLYHNELAEIASIHKQLQGDVRSSIYSIEQLTSKLDYQERLLYAVDLGSSSLVFWIGPKEFTVKAIKNMKGHIQRHRSKLANEEDSRETGGILYQLLGVPARSFQTVNVVTHGALESLPFSTLYIPENKSWLVENIKIQRFIHLGRLTNRRTHINSFDHLLAVSNPQFYQPAPPNFRNLRYNAIYELIMGLPELKDSIEESRSLLRITTDNLENIRELLELQTASERNVKSRLINQTWNMISFSTHTLFPSKEIPITYPGLALSLDFSDKENDALLLADEIAELNLKGSSILLAACDTAQASNIGGSFNSLVTSFHFAMASGVIASQWKVDSRETSKIIKKASTNAKLKKITFADSLIETQREIANEHKLHPTSASHWGAWEVYF